MNPYYTDYSEYLSRIFPGQKVQKLSVAVSGTCPNRDGTISRGGCTYCNNNSFSPAYCRPGQSVTDQIGEGKRFFARKYPTMRYLAYFQTYTSTHRADASRLEGWLNEAAECEGVIGIVVGTRPDCVPEEVIKALASFPLPVMIEFGAESSHNETLRKVNRGHSWAQTEDAVKRCAAAGLHCGLHLIMGLPGETEEMMMQTIGRACLLPIESVKLHQLQIIRGTQMEKEFTGEGLDIRQFTPESYADLCARIAMRIPRRIAIERFLSQSPPEMVVYPKWGLKNYQFAALVISKMAHMREIEKN